MATTLYLRNIDANIYNTGNTTQYEFMTESRGATADSGVVNTTASGTDIIWTKTAGGAVLAWISEPVDSTQSVTASTVTFNIWALESNMNANAGGRARLFRWSANNETETLIAGPANDGVEFGTAIGAFNWTTTATATTLLKGDRIVARFYITNIGTMATGFTCTLGFNGPTAGANGDSYVVLTDNLTFQRRIFVSP